MHPYIQITLAKHLTKASKEKPRHKLYTQTWVSTKMMTGAKENRSTLDTFFDKFLEDSV